MDPQNPLVAVPVMVGLALVAAFVTFKFLSSSGHAKTRFGEVGGAAAGFVVILGLLAGVYYRLEPRWAHAHDLERTVAEQRRVIASSRLPPGFTVPASFTPVIDRPHGLAFGYPSRWVKTYALQTFEEDPLSVPDGATPVNLVVVSEPLQKKTYTVGEVYKAARRSGVSAQRVRGVLGVPLTSKTATLQVDLGKVLTILGAKGRTTREALYDANYQLLRASLPGTFERQDDRLISGIPSLAVEHRMTLGSGQLLQFLTVTYLSQRGLLVSLTFSGSAADRQQLSSFRERVIGTLKFWARQP